MGLTMVFMSCNLMVECFNDWKSSAKTLSLLWLFSVKITILPSPGFGYGKVMNWPSNLVKIGKLITPHMNGKLDADAPETKEMVNQYLCWVGKDAQGRAFNQGKIFK